MKQRTKNILGLSLVVVLSAAVAGITTYSLTGSKKDNTSYNELFEQNPNVKLASFNGVDAQPVDFTQAAETSLHAVVHIKSTKRSKMETVQQAPDIFDFFFGDGRRGGGQRQMQTPEKVGFGSGVIISKDGYIVTNNHVIEGADEISVTLNDKREFKGRVIGADPNTDLALVKIEGDEFPTLPVGDSEALKVGEWVIAVGNPFNLTSTVTAGIVSAKARSLGVYGRNGGIESFIQTDAAINQGNSGGALVNTKGELIGINAVLSSPTGAFAGYGFAIPSSIMTKVVSDLKQFGTVQRAMLGIEGGDNNSELSKEKDLGAIYGVYVSKVVDGGSAADAGIEADDVIVGMDGKAIKTMAELQEALAKHRPGDKVNVKVIRDKKDKEITMTLKNAQGNTKVVKDAGMDILGAAFKELPAELKKQLNLGYGLQVTGVSAGKMKDAGIVKGFIILKVNGQSMKSVADLENALKSATQSPEQVLFMAGVFPSGKRANYAVDLSQE